MATFCYKNLSVITEDNLCKFGALLHCELPVVWILHVPATPGWWAGCNFETPFAGFCGSATRKTSPWHDGLVSCPASVERKNLVAGNQIIRPPFHGSSNFRDAQKSFEIWNWRLNEHSLAKVKQLYPTAKSAHTFYIFTKRNWQENSFCNPLESVPLVTLDHQSAGRAIWEPPPPLKSRQFLIDNLL